MIKTIVLLGTFEFIDGKVIIHKIAKSIEISGRDLSDIDYQADKMILDSKEFDSYLVPAFYDTAKIEWAVERTKDILFDEVVSTRKMIDGKDVIVLSCDRWEHDHALRMPDYLQWLNFEDEIINGNKEVPQ